MSEKRSKDDCNVELITRGKRTIFHEEQLEKLLKDYKESEIKTTKDYKQKEKEIIKEIRDSGIYLSLDFKSRFLKDFFDAMYEKRDGFFTSMFSDFRKQYGKIKDQKDETKVENTLKLTCGTKSTLNQTTLGSINKQLEKIKKADKDIGNATLEKLKQLTLEYKLQCYVDYIKTKLTGDAETSGHTNKNRVMWTYSMLEADDKFDPYVVKSLWPSGEISSTVWSD